MRPHLHKTSNSSTSATMTHTMPSHNDLILRAIEREREALLAKTHAVFSHYEHSSHAEEVVDDDDEDEYDNAPRYDVRGRQAVFRETVRQRQARLEFLRRQDAAKRRASRTRKSEETVMISLSRSVFYPTATYSPSASTCSDCSSDSDSLAEPDSDSDGEWDAPAPRVRLCVIDENEDEDEDDYTFSAPAIYEQWKPKQQPQRVQLVRSPSSPRSPVARAPSLESIPERPEIEA